MNLKERLILWLLRRRYRTLHFLVGDTGGESSPYFDDYNDVYAQIRAYEEG